MNKFTGILTIFLLVAIVVVGFIESVSTFTTTEPERQVISKNKDIMRVSLIGDFNTDTHADGSITTERPVFVADAEGTMHRVFNYGPDFVGPLKEGDKVYTTTATSNDFTGKKRIVWVTIDYLITEEDYKHAK